MNKSDFIKALESKLNIEEDKAIQINSIVEDTFIIGKKNKEVMIDKFMSTLKVNEEDANKIYDTVMSVISTGIKDKILHPFKGND
jgi:hypothetical protein